MDVKVHTFTSSRAAYDDAQTEDHIHDGDVLIVDGPTEKSAAVLMGAWPITVNEDYVTDVDGVFHSPKPGFSAEDVTRDYVSRHADHEAGFYTESLRVARAELAKLRARPEPAQVPVKPAALPVRHAPDPSKKPFVGLGVPPAHDGEVWYAPVTYDCVCGNERCLWHGSAPLLQTEAMNVGD
jgi:hypothetical protein